MIKQSDIVVTTERLDERTDVTRAVLRIGMNQYSTPESPTSEIETRCRFEIWRAIYGDIAIELEHAKRAAFCAASPGMFFQVSQAFEKLNEMLKFKQ